METQIKFQHRHRFELESRISSAMQQLNIGRSELAVLAIRSVRELWRKGRWHPQRKSPFLNRSDKGNKITVRIRLAPAVYTTLRKLSLALGVSMAETLRLALDLLMTEILLDGPGIVHEVLTGKPQPAVRFLGLNLLDGPDTAWYGIGRVLEFKISVVHRTRNTRDGP